MTKNFKLSAMPYAQAHVRTTISGGYGSATLVSYTTPVAALDTEGWLQIFGLYSATTRRHISAFVKEYCGIDYQTAKHIYEKGQKLNIYTGEVIPIK